MFFAGGLVFDADEEAMMGTTAAYVLSRDSKTWTEIAPMTHRRYGAVAGLLPSGHVIVAGGKNGRGGTPLARVELWDPEKNEWSPGPSMTRQRFLPCACVLPSGRFAVFGGHNDDEISRTGEWGRDDWIVYASAEAYTEADAMPRPLQDQQHDEADASEGSDDEDSTETGAWTFLPSMAVRKGKQYHGREEAARYGGGCVAVPGGALVVGGHNPYEQFVSTII